eukprot:6174188-Pleurochrysis_carterae.AAC.1
MEILQELWWVLVDSRGGFESVFNIQINSSTIWQIHGGKNSCAFHSFECERGGHTMNMMQKRTGEYANA